MLDSQRHSKFGTESLRNDKTGNVALSEGTVDDLHVFVVLASGVTKKPAAVRVGRTRQQRGFVVWRTPTLQLQRQHS
jgi:hypothetical protein